jgi:hypothetical protein
MGGLMVVRADSHEAAAKLGSLGSCAKVVRYAVALIDQLNLGTGSRY